MKTLQIISINHYLLTSEERIALELSEGHGEQLFAYMKHVLQVDGYVYLKTCNRVEVFVESEHSLAKKIMHKWLSLSDSNFYFDENHFEIFEGEKNCIDHILELSAGFKSAIFGDDQILSQMKKSFENARMLGTMSTYLERAYQAMMRFHKQVCRDTNYRNQTISLAYQTLKTVKDHFEAKVLSNSSLLIIGAGDMATQVVKYLPKFSIGKVSITNRTMEKADRLAKNKNIELVPWNNTLNKNYDIVISCTDMGFEMIQDWTRIKYYVDLSLQSIERKNIQSPHIVLHQLQALINTKNDLRNQSISEVIRIKDEKSDEFVDWCASWKERRTALLMEE